jgi:F0F1-type ATP synthase gamma subunit
MEKSFNTDINEINNNIKEAEKLLKESMGFYEDESIDDVEVSEDPAKSKISTEPEMTDIAPMVKDNSVDSYIDYIRKYTLNGLTALCDNPESEEYQILKKIFQLCDKKTERKDNISESHRLFGIMKESKKVVFETFIENKNEFKNLKESLIKEAISRGINPSEIRLVSENKIIR